MAHKGKPMMVEVEWLDARTIYEELPLREAPGKTPLVRRFSLGYIVVKEKERIVIAHTFDPAEDEEDLDGGADFTVIPRRWIEKIVELSPASSTSASSTGDGST